MKQKERAAMQAAWVWMDWYSSNNGTLEPVDFNETITALREALAEPKKPEECAKGCPPLQVCDYCQKAEQADDIDWIETNKALAKEIIELKKQAEQEPVAWGKFTKDCIAVSDDQFDGAIPLYTAPVKSICYQEAYDALAAQLIKNPTGDGMDQLAQNNGLVMAMNTLQHILNEEKNRG